MTADILDGYGAKLVLAIAVVSAALFLLYLVARMLGRRRASAPGRAAQGARRRLAVIETAAVDANRQLVLVRRDDVEHLILIGGPTDLVVEQNIVQAARAQSRANASGLRARNVIGRSTSSAVAAINGKRRCERSWLVMK